MGVAANRDGGNHTVGVGIDDRQRVALAVGHIDQRREPGHRRAQHSGPVSRVDVPVYHRRHPGQRGGRGRSRAGGSCGGSPARKRSLVSLPGVRASSHGHPNTGGAPPYGHESRGSDNGADDNCANQPEPPPIRPPPALMADFSRSGRIPVPLHGRNCNGTAYDCQGSRGRPRGRLTPPISPRTATASQ